MMKLLRQCLTFGLGFGWLQKSLDLNSFTAFLGTAENSQWAVTAADTWWKWWHSQQLPYPAAVLVGQQPNLFPSFSPFTVQRKVLGRDQCGEDSLGVRKVGILSECSSSY